MAIDSGKQVGSRYALTLEHATMGYVQSFTDGATTLKTGMLSAFAPTQWRVGAPLSALSMQVGFGMGKPVYDWIRSSLEGTDVSRNGAIVVAALDGTALHERRFSRALISEVSLPPMDANSKDAGFLTIKLSPSSVSYDKGTGQKLAAVAQTKPWLVSNFAVQIGALPCQKVIKIDAFSLKTAKANSAQSTLNLTVAYSDVAPWDAWYRDFVTRGSPQQTGSLKLLATNRTDVLATVNLYGVGIFDLNRVDAGKAAVATFAVKLYVERMTLG